MRLYPTLVMLVVISALGLSGCGKPAEEPTKAPEGSTYYQGEMTGKGSAGAAGEAPKAAQGSGAADQ